MSEIALTLKMILCSFALAGMPWLWSFHWSSCYRHSLSFFFYHANINFHYYR